MSIYLKKSVILAFCFKFLSVIFLGKVCQLCQRCWHHTENRLCTAHHTSVGLLNYR